LTQAFGHRRRLRCSGGTAILDCCATTPARGAGDGSSRLASDITRRKFLGACCATGFGIVAGGPIAAILSACGSESTLTSASTLRVGHLPAGCIQHLLLAQINGLFKKEGLNVVLTQFDGPPPNLQALVAGSIDVSHNPWTTVIAAYNDGQKDLRIVGGSGKGGIELVAREGSVKTVAELAGAADKGLKVGTLRLDTLELVTYGTLRDAGRSYSEYKMTFFPSMVGMGEALIHKSVDVASLAQPYGATVVSSAGGTYLNDSNQVWGPEASDCVVNVTAGYLEKNQSKLETYLHVLDEAAPRFGPADQGRVIERRTIYAVPQNILSEGLKRLTPQPVPERGGAGGSPQGRRLPRRPRLPQDGRHRQRVRRRVQRGAKLARALMGLSANLKIWRTPVVATSVAAPGHRRRHGWRSLGEAGRRVADSWRRVWELGARIGILNPAILPPPSEFIPYLFATGGAVGAGVNKVSYASS
jgi:NitT/TauT family transport system substrate-binding protein